MKPPLEAYNEAVTGLEQIASFAHVFAQAGANGCDRLSATDFFAFANVIGEKAEQVRACLDALRAANDNCRRAAE